MMNQLKSLHLNEICFLEVVWSNYCIMEKPPASGNSPTQEE